MKKLSALTRKEKVFVSIGVGVMVLCLMMIVLIVLGDKDFSFHLISLESGPWSMAYDAVYSLILCGGGFILGAMFEQRAFTNKNE